MLIKDRLFFSAGQSKFMGSAAFVQLIPLVTAPIIARLYAPEDFGAYAIFFGLVAIFSQISQFSLQEAILLESKDSSASEVLVVAPIIISLMSVILYVIQESIPESYAVEYLGVTVVALLPWMPATIFASSLYGCFYTWWIRKGLYENLARNTLILGFSTAIIQILIGSLGLDAIGFVWANLLGTSLATFLLLKVIIRDLSALRHEYKLALVWTVLVKHKSLAIFTMPSGLVNTASSYFPDYFSNFFSERTRSDNII